MSRYDEENVKKKFQGKSISQSTQDLDQEKRTQYETEHALLRQKIRENQLLRKERKDAQFQQYFNDLINERSSFIPHVIRCVGGKDLTTVQRESSLLQEWESQVFQRTTSNIEKAIEKNISDLKRKKREAYENFLISSTTLRGSSQFDRSSSALSNTSFGRSDLTDSEKRRSPTAASMMSYSLSPFSSTPAPSSSTFHVRCRSPITTSVTRATAARPLDPLSIEADECRELSEQLFSKKQEPFRLSYPLVNPKTPGASSRIKKKTDSSSSPLVFKGSTDARPTLINFDDSRKSSSSLQSTDDSHFVTGSEPGVSSSSSSHSRSASLSSQAILGKTTSSSSESAFSASASMPIHRMHSKYIPVSPSSPLFSAIPSTVPGLRRSFVLPPLIALPTNEETLVRQRQKQRKIARESKKWSAASNQVAAEEKLENNQHDETVGAFERKKEDDFKPIRMEDEWEKEFFKSRSADHIQKKRQNQNVSSLSLDKSALLSSPAALSRTVKSQSSMSRSFEQVQRSASPVLSLPLNAAKETSVRVPETSQYGSSPIPSTTLVSTAALVLTPSQIRSSFSYKSPSSLRSSSAFSSGSSVSSSSTFSHSAVNETRTTSSALSPSRSSSPFRQTIDHRLWDKLADTPSFRSDNPPMRRGAQPKFNSDSCVQNTLDELHAPSNIEASSTFWGKQGVHTYGDLACRKDHLASIQPD
ncbi:uncharacterized protein MONOS_1169 [Monocercomonoides exilis]|uniref:uncharacterized protein n=1 Tax=Monocercomonoides exilis TaxID=2049356 RepID=UPI00355AB16F|nr:hypothetical protein MONOS_1169 [Monocercomonoides exilis]|eukprot:MONOS_1169.1-p1 / transcript=MONOS_1169.1 / gene=MONOS_1169 / organism=Monocercomonoides_exilis_PA203 / gene_product=unspecified product / transcript_product=unspecified product / location=Mono_scaffold00020:12815-15227(-) / protein_length=701 / sequence_SO=supercontig / SO=protein_coding / is_pseudo=false